jgi:hypothetical protein
MSKFLFFRKFKKFHSNSNFHLNPSILVAKNLKFIFLFTSCIRPSLQRQPILLRPFGQAVHWPCGLVWPIGTHPLPWAIMPLRSPASSAVPCPLASRPPNWFRPLLYRNGCRLHHSPDSPPPLPKPKWPPWISTCHRPLKPPDPSFHRLRPIKGPREDHHSAPYPFHLPLGLAHTGKNACAIAVWSWGLTAVMPLCHRLPCSGEHPIDSVAFPSPFFLYRGELLLTVASFWPPSGERPTPFFLSSPWTNVARGTPFHGPSPHLLLYNNNCKPR